MRDFLVGVFPLRFESTAGIAAAIEPLAIYDLPDDWWHTYRSKLEAVTPSATCMPWPASSSGRTRR